MPRHRVQSCPRTALVKVTTELVQSPAVQFRPRAEQVRQKYLLHFSEPRSMNMIIYDFIICLALEQLFAMRPPARDDRNHLLPK